MARDKPTDSAEEGQRGTVYVVSVSGAKMNWLGAAPDEPTGFARREAEDTQFFQIISIDGHTAVRGPDGHGRSL